MSITTKTNEQKNKSRNAVYDRALSIGEKALLSKNNDEYCIQLTYSQKQKLEDLVDFLGISRGTLINIAINSAISLINIKNITLDQLKDYPKQLGSENIPVNLSDGTLISIEDANLHDKISECAVIGIKYIHNKLLYRLLKN